ncbi:MAG: hypothetical protein E6I87_00660 [Chloroflexi bacterium]|nr:MAG: hypothetical protein E6I87_00660 [Chloroflexota bacterium]
MAASSRWRHWRSSPARARRLGLSCSRPPHRRRCNCRPSARSCTPTAPSCGRCRPAARTRSS